MQLAGDGSVAKIRESYAAIAKVEIEPLTDRGLAFEGARLILPTVAIATMSGTACEVRLRGEDGDRGNGKFVLGIAVGSHLHLSQRDSSSVECVSGEAYLRDNNQPGGSIIAGDRPGTLNIALPYETVATALRDPNRRLRKLPQSAGLNLLVGYVGMLLREGGNLSAATALVASTHIQDLAILAIGGSGDVAEAARGRGLRAARLNAIKDDIAANIANPRLSPTWLSARHGISERYLRSLFADEETSFTDFVLERRLTHVLRRLSDPRHADQPVSIMAYDVGFNDLSWFNRAFRRHFGVTPSEARAAVSVSRFANGI